MGSRPDAVSSFSEDVLVYGSNRWDQPWLTEHQLAAALGRRTRVLYVDPPRSAVAALRAARGSAGTSAPAPATAAGSASGVTVTAVSTLPRASDLRIARLAAPWVRGQVASALRRSGLSPTLMLAARTPSEGVPIAGSVLRVALVKDWLQAGGHLTGLDPSALKRQQEASWGQADLICATSSRLVDRLREEGFPARLLRHGFDGQVAASYDHPADVPELVGLPRPLLAAVGRIDDRWDFGALQALAQRHPRGTVILVGPVNPRFDRSPLTRLLALDNVRLFGAVSSAALPGWLSRLDCCLVPYHADEWQRYASPLKVWDYLYAGRPIAASGSPALGEFPPGLIHFAESSSRIPDLVDAALAEDPATPTARRAYAAANTWDDRVDELLGLVTAARGAGR